MSANIKILSQPIGITVDDLVALYPEERWAIITIRPEKPKDMIVEWASPKQLEIFPGLVGSICYKRTKDFSAPCKWCPCLEAIEKGRIITNISESPKYRTGGSGLFDSNYDTGEVLYTVLAAVPIDPGPGGIKRVLEFSYDLTVVEKLRHQFRMESYEFAATLSTYIESRISRDLANELILLSAVASKGLSFPKAKLLVTDPNVDSVTGSTPIITECLTLSRDKMIKPQIEDLEMKLLAKDSRPSPEDLRAILFPLIKRKTFETPCSFLEFLKEEGVCDPQRFERLLGIPFGQRLHSRGAFVLILGYQQKLHGILMVETDGNRLISDHNLRHISIFALSMNIAYVTRDISNAYGKAEQKLNELTRLYGEKTEDLILTGAIISGIGHDLKFSRGYIADWIDTLIGGLSESKKESKELKVIIKDLKKQLEFQKNCLDRILHPARITKPWFSSYNIREVIQEGKDSLQYTLDAKNINIEIINKLDSNKEIIECDNFLIKQVITNLIDNSIYWMPDKGKKQIQIELNEFDEKNIAIDYKDTGPGITPNLFEEIWKPFFTIKPSGVGLGLFIVKRVVESHRGSIKPYCQSKWGACFKIQLPRKQG